MYRFVSSTKVFLVAAVAGTALAGAVATAAAAAPAAPISGDDRATVHPGNRVAADCAELFAGSTSVDLADLPSSIDPTDTYLDVTAREDGVEVAGVVVKGGPAYNVYDSEGLGDLAWLRMHAPLVPSGKPAQISHWFVCGVTTTTTTGTATTTATTTSTGSTTSTSTTDTTTTADGEQPTSASTPVPTTTTSAAVAPVASDEDLASTGFDGGWLIMLAAALLLGGGALLIVVRLRGAKR
jgi:hypothetical protein